MSSNSPKLCSYPVRTLAGNLNNKMFIAHLYYCSVVNHSSKSIIAFPFVWDVERLKDVREGSVIATYSRNRSF